MDCGANDTLCQVLVWLFHDNEYATAVFTKVLGESGLLGSLSAFLQEHGDKLIGLAGFSFGIYRWWKYREQILHKRLEEYLRESDRRLLEGQSYVLSALQRPRPGQKFQLPLFADKLLVSVLRERNWDRTPVATNVMSSADAQLTGAVNSIQRRILTAERTIGSLRQQLATAHVLQGAIASARAKRSRAAFEENQNALGSFRAALQIPGQEKNLAAKEFEAHQLRKLGDLPRALGAYRNFEQDALAFADYRTQRLAVARSKRFQAEIIQAQYTELKPDGSRSFKGTRNAYDLISPTVAGSALSILMNFGPFRGWELSEQAELHYLTAFVARNLTFKDREEIELNEAIDRYEELLRRSKSAFFGARSARRLHSEAERGRLRVQHAQREGDYDIAWLLPPLDQPKQQADGVGAGRSN